MEYTKEDLRKVFNNVINEIETTNGRVLSIYDLRNLASRCYPLAKNCFT